MDRLTNALREEQVQLEDDLEHVKALLKAKQARPSVLYFAALMERLLKAHDEDRGDRGWGNDSADALLNRLDDELKELRQAIVSGTPQEIAREAGDVGNFVMMIADNTGKLE